MEKLSNVFTLPVITPSGEPLGQPREVYNIAHPELFPNVPVVIVDWAATGRRPKPEEISVPIPYKGQMYRGDRAWGSAIKRWQSIGWPEDRDLLVECGLLKTAERTIMSGRMLLNEGLYGGLKGELRVQVVKAGTIINGYPVADGHSLIRRSVAEMGYDEEQEPIQLDGGRLNYSIDQRIPWDKIKDEVEPVLIDHLLDIKSDEFSIRDDAQGRPELTRERMELAQLDPVMEEHPYVAKQYSRANAEFFARTATTIPMPVQVRIAVPTTAPRATCRGKKVLVRYPVDSNGSMQAVHCNPRKEEEQRIAGLEVLQYTIASKGLMAKGCLGVIDDSLMPEGVDIVLCQDDIKMGSKHLGGRLVEGVVTFNQRFERGTAIGINAEWAKDLMGLDFDGDLVFAIDCKEFPRVYRAVLELEPGTTKKIVKTKSPLYLRGEMMLNSMANLVGFATNVAASTYLLADRERIAEALGYKSVTAMDKALNYYVKLGTDMFKTLIDLPAIEKQLGRLQTKLRSVVSRMAPWSKWPNAWAFTRGCPGYWYEGMQEHENRNAILEWWDGTIPQICRITLPYLKDVIGQPVKMRPLSAFKDWAHIVAKDELAGAITLQKEFVARAQGINFADSSDWIDFRKWWQGRVEAWMNESGHSRTAACAALWRAAHTTRSEEAVGASVFMAFPDEVKDIIREKPGLKAHALETLLLGCGFVFDDLQNLDCEVEVREFTQVRNNKKLIRTIVCGQVEGKKEPREPYPPDLIGMVDMRSFQPEKGHYRAFIVKSGKGQAWHCRLVAV